MHTDQILRFTNDQMNLSEACIEKRLIIESFSKQSSLVTSVDQKYEEQLASTT